MPDVFTVFLNKDDDDDDDVCVCVCVWGGGGVRGGSLLRNFRKSERYVPPHLKKKRFHPWGSCLPKDPPFSANYMNEDYYV